jgi:hypothetical protein
MPTPDLRPPHCDALVLHAPGDCRFCDRHPDWQAYRTAVGIAFTGQEPVDGQIQCPAETSRPAEVIHAWPGNRPVPPGTQPPGFFEAIVDLGGL